MLLYWMGKLTAKFADCATGFFVDPDRVDSILMDSLQLRVNLSLSLEIHLTEHVKGRLLTSTARFSCLGFDCSCKLP